MAASLGLIQKSYVSATAFLDTREINKNVTDIANDKGLSEILTLADKKMPTTQPFYSTFVNETVFKLVVAGDTVTGSGSVQITTNLTAATSLYNRVDDILLFADNNTGIITNVSTTSGVDTIIIKSLSGANLTLVSGNTMSSNSVAVGENSTSRQNIRFNLTRYFNKVQVFSETSQITDVQGASLVEVEFEGQPKFQVKDHIEKVTKLNGEVNAAFISGQMSTTSFSDVNPTIVDNVTSGISGGYGIQTTRGVNDYIRLYGTSLNTGVSSYTQGNIDDVCDSLLAARAPKDQMVLTGRKAKRITDTYWKALGSSGVQSVRMVIDGKEIDTQVDRVHHGGFNFEYVVMPIFDNPTLMNPTGNISKSQYFLSKEGQVPVFGGGYDPTMRVRYMPSQNMYGNEMIGETHYGALSIINPNGTGQFMGCDWTTTQGLECLGVQFFVKQQVFQ